VQESVIDSNLNISVTFLLGIFGLHCALLSVQLPLMASVVQIDRLNRPWFCPRCGASMQSADEYDAAARLSDFSSLPESSRPLSLPLFLFFALSWDSSGIFLLL
jgi:hypothetical protein